MNKNLILAMALSLVLVSGALFSAQADCGLNPCGFHLPSLCSLHCGARDTDARASASDDKPAFQALRDTSPWTPGQ
jgi:hypothetical protein